MINIIFFKPIIYVIFVITKQTDMKEFVVTFKTSRQISPDDWEVFNPSMKVTETTTVKEISDFFCKHVKEEPVEVKLIQLEQSSSNDR